MWFHILAHGQLVFGNVKASIIQDSKCGNKSLDTIGNKSENVEITTKISVIYYKNQIKSDIGLDIIHFKSNKKG